MAFFDYIGMQQNIKNKSENKVMCYNCDYFNTCDPSKKDYYISNPERLCIMFFEKRR